MFRLIFLKKGGNKMEKIITIGDKEVRLNNNIEWAIIYRDQFGKDILPVVMPFITTMIESVATVLADSETNGEITATSIAEALSGRSLDVLLPLYQAEFVDLVLYVLWSMAKTADEKIDPPRKWIKQFDNFYLDEIIPELLEMVLRGLVSSKNLKRLEGIKTTLRPITSDSTT